MYSNEIAHEEEVAAAVDDFEEGAHLEERKASLFGMISDRHVYGDSGASEVCRERAGMSLLICRALNASLFE